MSPRLLALLALASGVACYDPVHEDGVANLGGEQPGTAPGPFHRAGQPCLVCHSYDGPSDTKLAIAGTVYATRGSSAPLDSATITVTDALGVSRGLLSNGAGNFYVRADEWQPTFPVRVKLEAEGVTRTMTTSIGRDGSCATCHRNPGDRTFMPGVFLRDK